MNKSPRFSYLLFISFALLSFYSFGTAMMDYFMLYPSRFYVGDSEFVQYHKFLESAILPISVFPFLAIILLNILLVWLRHEHIPNILVFISLACLVVDLILTIFFLAPWNFELGNAKNIELMEKITAVNWLRVFLETTQVVVVFIMLEKLVFNLTREAAGAKKKVPAGLT